MYMTRNGLAGLPYLNLLGVKKKYRGQGDRHGSGQKFSSGL